MTNPEIINEAPTFRDRPKDAYWSACAAVLWRQVRVDFLPRMRLGERTIQAFMREPITTEIAMMRIDRTPATQALDPVLFVYDEVTPGDGSERYWVVEASTDYNPWLMEAGSITPADRP
jgi:hypothetical protein